MLPSLPPLSDLDARRLGAHQAPEPAPTGVEYTGAPWELEIRQLITDEPARAFVLQIRLSGGPTGDASARHARGKALVRGLTAKFEDALAPQWDQEVAKWNKVCGDYAANYGSWQFINRVNEGNEVAMFFNHDSALPGGSAEGFLRACFPWSAVTVKIAGVDYARPYTQTADKGARLGETTWYLAPVGNLGSLALGAQRLLFGAP